MREITTHKGNELDDALTIRVVDQPGHGGACHHYSISGDEFIYGDIRFQNGPIKKHGPNGISIESLLAICIDRLEGFQLGNYASLYNEVALANLHNALGSLQARTKNRQERGVEGTSAQ